MCTLRSHCVSISLKQLWMALCILSLTLDPKGSPTKIRTSLKKHGSRSPWQVSLAIRISTWKAYQNTAQWCSGWHWLARRIRNTKNRGTSLRSIYFGLSPLPVTVTTRIIPFLVGNPYKPSFPLLLGGGTTQYIFIKFYKSQKSWQRKSGNTWKVLPIW